MVLGQDLETKIVLKAQKKNGYLGESANKG